MQDTQTPEERFKRFIAVNPLTRCHIWRGSINNKGYGQFSFGGSGKNVLAHRWIFEQTTGRQIQDGFQVDHKCARPCCVNPEHLEEVSPEINALRASIYARLEQHNVKKQICTHEADGCCLECRVRRQLQKETQAKARNAANATRIPQTYSSSFAEVSQ